MNVKWETFTEFVKDCINLGYYILTPLNLFYISHSKNHFHSNKIIHDTFIFGYDESKKIMHIADFYDYNKFNFFTIDFDNFDKSYIESMTEEKEMQNHVVLIKINESYDIEDIDIDFIKISLNDYLNSEDSTKKYVNAGRWKNTYFYYGLKYYDELIIDLQSDKGDIRSLHVIYDYMKMLQFKIDTLVNKKIITDSSYLKLKSKLIEVMTLSLTNRNLYLKMLLKKNNDLASKIKLKDKIITNCMLTKEMSTQFTEQLLKDL